MEKTAASPPPPPHTFTPVDPATVTDCMEQLQEGYVASVAATAGCLFQKFSKDRFGFDTMLVRPRPVGEEISVFTQLKCTTTERPDPSKPDFGYRFRKRQYFDRLATIRSGIKAILIVMATHPAQARWTNGSHDRLELLYCCYWAYLEGLTVGDHIRTPTVRVPTSNVFDANALTWILDTLDRGGDLHDTSSR